MYVVNSGVDRCRWFCNGEPFDRGDITFGIAVCLVVVGKQTLSPVHDVVLIVCLRWLWFPLLLCCFTLQTGVASAASGMSEAGGIGEQRETEKTCPRQKGEAFV